MHTLCTIRISYIPANTYYDENYSYLSMFKSKRRYPHISTTQDIYKALMNLKYDLRLYSLSEVIDYLIDYRKTKIDEERNVWGGPRPMVYHDLDYEFLMKIGNKSYILPRDQKNKYLLRFGTRDKSLLGNLEEMGLVKITKVRNDPANPTFDNIDLSIRLTEKGEKVLDLITKVKNLIETGKE